jgi:hypothetical protein
MSMRATNHGELYANLVLGERVNAMESEREQMRAAGATARRVYRVPEFISKRKQQETGVTQTVDRAGRVAFKVKETAVEALSMGDWVTGNAQIMLQMLRDGSLVKVSSDCRSRCCLDTSELEDYLHYVSRIGELFDLGFDRARVMRLDDECRLDTSESSWRARCADLGLVAAHLMAPQRGMATRRGETPAQRRNDRGVCFDFNRETGCHRKACRFAHRCRRCGLDHSEVTHGSDVRQQQQQQQQQQH